MSMEKLGVEKEQLKEELQAEYSRLVLKQHELRKEASAAPALARTTNEIEEVQRKIDELSK